MIAIFFSFNIFEFHILYMNAKVCNLNSKNSKLVIIKVIITKWHICTFCPQVEHEFIYYVHDGSESLEDSFTVTANDTVLRKQSLPGTVHIQVSAVNDEAPIITANRVLRVSGQCCVYI